MADRALLAGYHRYTVDVWLNMIRNSTLWHSVLKFGCVNIMMAHILIRHNFTCCCWEIWTSVAMTNFQASFSDWGISFEIALRWTFDLIIVGKSTLLQLMPLFRQVTNNYLRHVYQDLCRHMASMSQLIQAVDAYIDGLVQDCSISSALAMEILQSCTKSLICCWVFRLMKPEAKP